MEIEAKEFKGTFKVLPVRSDLPDYNEQLVVELYSK
jgi:ribosomal protein S4